MQINLNAFLDLLTLKIQESAIICYGNQQAMNLLYNWGFTESNGNDLGSNRYVIVAAEKFVSCLSNYVAACFKNNGESKNFKGDPEAFDQAVAKMANKQMSLFKITDDTPYDSALRDIHFYGVSSNNSSKSPKE